MGKSLKFSIQLIEIGNFKENFSLMQIFEKIFNFSQAFWDNSESLYMSGIKWDLALRAPSLEAISSKSVFVLNLLKEFLVKIKFFQWNENEQIFFSELSKS